MSSIIKDADQRRQIENVLDKNFLIEAGAGSGKTTSLVNRMINIICTGKGTIDQIVAITFTKKAADELKGRFQNKLEIKYQLEVDKAVKGQLENALQNIDKCFIGTIHAFCNKSLQERPIEAGLDIAFRQIEEDEDNELVIEAVLECLEDREGKYTQEKEQVLTCGFDINSLKEYAKEFKKYTDVEWILNDRSEPDLKDTYKRLRELIISANEDIPIKEPEKGYDDLQKKIKQTINKLKHLDINDRVKVKEILEAFEGNVKVTQNRWDDKARAKQWQQEFKDFQGDILEPILTEWKQYAHSKVTHFVKVIIACYEKIKVERLLLSQQDLILKTRDLLRNNQEVREYFQRKFKFLLIDEFQDTDPIQAEIMFYLTGENTEELEWRNCKPRAGSLFVVGDPKQAIYRFRRADIDSYNEVKQLIKQYDGEVLELTSNFRSIQPVTEKLNKVFKILFPSEATQYQAAFGILDAQKEKTNRKLAGIHILKYDGKLKKDEVIDSDSKSIANQIVYLIEEEGYEPKDFMVINRYNECLVKYAEAITQKGIPVCVSGKVILGDLIEVKELMILLEALSDITDEVKIVATLKGVFFGISDEELYQWRKKKYRYSIYETEGIKDDSLCKIAKALSRLKEYSGWTREYSPVVAIEKIAEGIGLYPLLIERGYEKEIYFKLVMLIEEIRKTELGGICTFIECIQSLKIKLVQQVALLETEQESNAVRVMNIHKAKGLEAPIVFLACPQKLVDITKKVTTHIARNEKGATGYFVFKVANGQFNSKEAAIPLGWEAKKKEELKYLEEEEKRIVYVAATRAEEALIISSVDKNDKNPWARLLDIGEGQEIEIIQTKPDLESLDLHYIELDTYQDELKSYSQWHLEKAEPTYTYYVPSRDKDYEKIHGVERESGGGKNWGSLVHEALEKAVNDELTSSYIKTLLQKYEIGEEREEEVMRYVEQFKASSIWKALQHADQVLTEVPIHMSVKKPSLLYEKLSSKLEVDCAIRVSGIIDLIYKKGGKWTIVDYKTDRINKGSLASLVEFYKDQVEFYKLAWEEISKEKVERVALYFNELDKAVEV